MKNLLFACFLILIAFSACKTDVDLNAPYKENMVIMGLLNPDTNVQYIRVNKAFLGNGNVYNMAKIPDSTNYKIGDLSVVVTDNLNGSTTFTPTTILTNDAAFGGQIIAYKADFQPQKTNAQGSNFYNLIVTNLKTGKITRKDSLHLIGNIVLNQPNYDTKNKRASLRMLDPSGAPTTLLNVGFENSLYGRVYEAVIRFNYFITPGDTQHVDFNVGTVNVEPRSVKPGIAISYSGEAFFNNLKANLPAGKVINFSSTKAVTIIITAGDNDLSNYIQVNAPSSTVNQNKPEYTNIKGGIGLFAARTITYFKNVQFDVATETYLKKTMPYLKANP